MKSAILFLFLLALTRVNGFAHGKTYEYVGSTGYFPKYPQSDYGFMHPAYAVHVSVNSEANHSLKDGGPKQVIVGLIRRGVTKQTVRYTVDGANITWDIQWTGPGHAILRVFSGSRGPFSFFAKHKREVLAVRYDYNPKSGSYREHGA